MPTCVFMKTVTGLHLKTQGHVKRKLKQTACDSELSQTLMVVKVGVGSNVFPSGVPDRDAREAEEFHPWCKTYRGGWMTQTGVAAAVKYDDVRTTCSTQSLERILKSAGLLSICVLKNPLNFLFVLLLEF